MPDKFPRKVREDRLVILHMDDLFTNSRNDRGEAWCLAQREGNEFILSTGWPVGLNDAEVVERPSWISAYALKRLYQESRDCSSMGFGTYLDRFSSKAAILNRLQEISQRKPGIFVRALAYILDKVGL